jgi:hypothetical protein
MADTFYAGTDWEGSSGPIISRMVPVTDLWPIGAGSESGGATDKDELENGLHPAVALGPSANRPKNLTGVVMALLGTLAQINLADKFVSKQYVANVLTYDQGDPDTFSATFAALAPVYIDDSAGLGAGVTLSLSPLNDADLPNPLFGYIFYCQDEYADSEVGGPNERAALPATASDSVLVESLLCVMQVNDFGISEAPPTG